MTRIIVSITLRRLLVGRPEPGEASGVAVFETGIVPGAAGAKAGAPVFAGSTTLPVGTVALTAAAPRPGAGLTGGIPAEPGTVAGFEPVVGFGKGESFCMSLL